MDTQHPKRTLTSRAKCDWWRRNGSSNVSSSMGCVDEYEEPRRVTIFSKSPEPVEQFTGFCKSCYCKGKTVEPVLKCERLAKCCEPNETRVRLEDGANSNETHTTRRRNYEHLSSSYFVHPKKCGTGLDQGLLDFRNKHFFECHSGSDLTSSTVPHVCQYRFRVNKNLKAQAENIDEFGTSRCSVCSKPISSSSLQLVPLDRTPSETIDGPTSEVIINANESEQILLEVPKTVIEEVNNPKKVRKKKYPPANSLALKYQKGVFN